MTLPSSLTFPPFSPSGLSQEAKKGKKALVNSAAAAFFSEDASLSLGGEVCKTHDSPLLIPNPHMKQQGPVRIRDGVEITLRPKRINDLIRGKE